MGCLSKYLALASTALAFATGMAVAQPQDQTARISTLFDAAIAEQRIILNCSLTLADETPDLLQAEWQRNASDALNILSDADFSTLYIFALRAKTSIGAIIMAGDTSFVDVVEMCRAEPDWYRNVILLRGMDLKSEIREILAE